MDLGHWRDPRWLADVHTWLDRELDRLGLTATGPTEQTHVYAWSTVLRVATDRGTVWFKAAAAPLRHEVTVVQRISARSPELVPPLLAADPERGWMLMADAGESMRSVAPRERSLRRWHEILRRYAGLQLDLADEVPGLLAAGVPDVRLATLPAAYEGLLDRLGDHADAALLARLRDATALVARLSDELAAYGLPELLQHDDLHDGQVYLRDGRYAVLDWGDACISHPFFTLAVTLDGVLSWGLDDVRDSVDVTGFRDAYLEPFARCYEGDLVAASTVARRLGWAARAVNGHVSGDEASTLTRLRMFLDGQPS